MPYIDRTSGELVMRIVYDGAPEAGKTTNLRTLCSAVALQRRGEVESPGTEQRRTEFFDWLDFVGGYVDGRKVRCQLVSVPGQSQLLHRRRYLLDAADAIVFVADSRIELVEAGLESLATTLRVVQEQSQEAPLGVVLQANKQDLDGAIDPYRLAERLQSPARAAVIGASAHRGEGVMHTFITAVRVASKRVRALAQKGLLRERERGAEDGADGLYVRMRAREGGALSRGVRSSVIAGDRAEQGGLPPLRGRVNPAARQPPRLPATREVAAGLVWPPTTGRGVLAAARVAEGKARATLSPWAQQDDLEILTPADVSLTSRAAWCFEGEHRARQELLSMVRQHLSFLPVLPEGRVLFVDAQNPARVWMSTPNLPTLYGALDDALARRDERALPLLLGSASEICAHLAMLGSEDAPRLESLGLEDGGSSCVLLAHPPGQTADGPTEQEMLQLLLKPVRQAATQHPELLSTLRGALDRMPHEAASKLAGVLFTGPLSKFSQTVETPPRR